MFVFLGSLIIYGLFLIATVLLWLFALISILKNDFKDATTKIIWFALVLILPVLGAILYFIIGRKQIITKIQQEIINKQTRD